MYWGHFKIWQWSWHLWSSFSTDPYTTPDLFSLLGENPLGLLWMLASCWFDQGEGMAGDWSMSWKVELELWLSFPSRLQGARLAFTGFFPFFQDYSFFSLLKLSWAPNLMSLSCHLGPMAEITFGYWQLLLLTFVRSSHTPASLRNLTFTWWRCDESVTEIFSVPQN